MSFRGRLRERAEFAQSRTIGKTEYVLASTGVPYFTSYQNYVAVPNVDVVSMERTTDQLHGRPPYTTGGPFASFKSEYPVDKVEGEAYYQKKVGLTIFKYTGGFLPAGFGNAPIAYTDLRDVGLKGLFGPSFGDPSSHGAEAFNKFRPKTSGFDGATFLGELRDMPGMLKDAAKKFNSIYQGLGGKKTDLFMPKTIAKDFLGYNFGWVPFMSDMRKLRRTYHAYDQILRRLRRQNDQWVKKGGIVLEENEVTDKQDLFAQDAPAIWPAPPTQLVVYPYPGRPNKWGNTLFETQTETRIWFEGSFKYHIPWLAEQGLPNWRLLQGYMQVYGLRISPSLVWNLAPWSWLADWFVNIGDVIDNVTAITADRLVAKYAYLMATSRRKRFNASTIHLYNGSVNCLWHQRIDVKRRESASPFGFSLNADSFSAYQWSILSALGLSRGRK